MSTISMKRVIPAVFFCLGLLVATAAADPPLLRVRLRHDDSAAIVPVKNASAVRPSYTASDDRDDVSGESAAVRAATAARIAELRKHTEPEAAQASILPATVGVLGGCLIAALGVAAGVRLWKKKLSQQWAEAVRARSRKRTVILLHGIIAADSAAAGNGVSPVFQHNRRQEARAA